MLNQTDVAKLRQQGMTNRQILEMMAPVVPSARDALQKIDSDTSTPKWQVDIKIGQMLDKGVPKNAPSGMSYLQGVNLNMAQKKFDQTTEKQVEPQISSPIQYSGREMQPTTPKEFLSGAASTLPMIGGVIGGTIGAGAGIPTGPGAIATGVAGAAAGGAIGEAGEQAAKRLLGTSKEMTLGQEYKEIGKEALTTGVAELGGGMIARAAKGVLSPFTRLFQDEIAQLAAKKGITMPASALTESNIVRIGETVSSKGLAGGGVEQIVRTANEKVLSLADDIVKKIGGSDDILIAGKSIEDGASQFRKIWTETKNKLYQNADSFFKERPKKEFIDVSDTVNALDNILSSKESAGAVLGKSVVTKRLISIRDNLMKKQSIKNISNAITELNQLTGYGTQLVSTGDEAALRKVAVTLSGDLDKHISMVSPELGAALDKADAFYKNGIQILESRVGKNIGKLAESPEKILDSILRPNAPSDARRLIELIGAGEGGVERMANVRTAFAKKIVDSATSARTGNIMGSTLTQTLKKYGTTIDVMFDKQTIGALDDVAKLAKALDRSQVVAEGSSTAFSSKLMGMIFAVLNGSFKTAFNIAAGDIILNKIFTSQVGRKWVTKGLIEAIPETGKAAIRTGTQAIGQILSD